jgi:RsiW-degrading membrane proteinase PrsW (M82 family)
MVGILSAALLEHWLLPAGVGRYVAVGFIEELAKGVVVVASSAGLRRRRVRDGIVLGTAIGLGYAGFESAGYAFSAYSGLVPSSPNFGSGLANLLWTEAERSLLVTLLHGAWTGLLAAALFKASPSGRLRLSALVLAAYLLVSGSHAGWDSIDSLPGLVLGSGLRLSTSAHLLLTAAQLVASVAVYMVALVAFVVAWSKGTVTASIPLYDRADAGAGRRRRGESSWASGGQHHLRRADRG